jgi:hypothetical protein
MSAVPHHLQRRFEQKWAARFGPPPAAINAPKNVGSKAAPAPPAGRRGVRQKPKETPAGVKPSRRSLRPAFPAHAGTSAAYRFSTAMEEHVLAATAVPLNETVAFGRIEPLHCPGCHLQPLKNSVGSQPSLNAPCPARKLAVVGSMKRKKKFKPTLLRRSAPMSEPESEISDPPQV